MSVAEPVLTAADRAAWDRWSRTCAMHARTVEHRRRVESARRTVAEAFDASTSWAVMVSGGKDSTALASVVAGVAPGVQLASEKDDMDYPGEREYVEHLAARLGCPIDIITPPVSPREVIARMGAEVGAMGDWHGRAAELSRVCFYEPVEAYSSRFAGVFLGLRQDESRGRRMNRATHGRLYRKASARHADGQLVCTPLADWRDVDVYGYLGARGIDLLPVYRCIDFMHRDRPGAIRKSWWIPEGNAARHGGVAWLRRYYPSLYRTLIEWVPSASELT